MAVYWFIQVCMSCLKKTICSSELNYKYSKHWTLIFSVISTSVTRRNSVKCFTPLEPVAENYTHSVWQHVVNTHLRHCYTFPHWGPPETCRVWCQYLALTPGTMSRTVCLTPDWCLSPCIWHMAPCLRHWHLTSVWALVSDTWHHV